MLACRVCLAVGIDDPEEWLDTATPRQLAIWDAFYRLEPWGSDMMQTATLSSQVSCLVAMMASYFGIKDIEPRPVDDFMPSNWADARKSKPKKRRTQKQKTKAMEQVFASIFPTAKQNRIR